MVEGEGAKEGHKPHRGKARGNVGVVVVLPRPQFLFAVVECVVAGVKPTKAQIQTPHKPNLLVDDNHLNEREVVGRPNVHPHTTVHTPCAPCRGGTT